MISEVLQAYYPEWEPPEDYGTGAWVKCLCPVHADEHPSASINFAENAFVCHGCGYKGTYASIIMNEEGVGYREAIRIAEGIAESSGVPVPRVASGKRRRKVPRRTRFNRL